VEKYLIAEFQRYAREPVIRRMPNGMLVCLFLTGGPTEPHNENVVKIAKSYNDGVTWSEPEVLFSHDSRGCWSPELFCDCEKPFAIVLTNNAPAHYRELQTFYSFFDDSTELWTEPKSIPGSINGCSIRQGFVLSNGDILFPLYWQETRDKFKWEKKDRNWDEVNWPFVCGVGISSDGGAHFNRYGYIDANRSLWEPNAVEVEPGHIIMYCRSIDCYLYMSESFDFGRTWTQATITDIPNADTKLTLFKERDKIFLINNFNNKRGWKNRTNLAIAISDDGKHFEKIIDIENPSESWFYPHAFVDKEKETVYVAYENAKQHWLKKYSFSELSL